MSTQQEKIVEKVVIKPNFYMSVNGKMQIIEVGTRVSLTESQAERMKSKLGDVTVQKKATADQKKATADK